MNHEKKMESVARYYKKHPIAQERHHAAHALFLLWCMCRTTLKGEKVKRRTLRRIILHLRDLREFLQDSSLNELVNSLCKSLQAEYDQSFGALTRGLHRGLRAVLGNKASSALIARFREEETRPQIFMADWVLANQDRLLGFAEHYDERHLFQNLLPIHAVNSLGAVKKPSGRSGECVSRLDSAPPSRSPIKFTLPPL